MTSLDKARSLHNAAGRRRVNSFWHQQSGASGVEAALVLPVFLACMLFVVEFGRVLYSKVEFEYALNVATRVGMVQTSNDAAKVKKAVTDHFVLLDPAKLAGVTFTEMTNADNSKTATITANYKVNFLLPVTKSRSVTLSRSVSFLKPQ